MRIEGLKRLSFESDDVQILQLQPRRGRGQPADVPKKRTSILFIPNALYFYAAAAIDVFVRKIFAKFAGCDYIWIA